MLYRRLAYRVTSEQDLVAESDPPPQHLRTRTLAPGSLDGSAKTARSLSYLTVSSAFSSSLLVEITNTRFSVIVKIAWN
ncbi:hypothetical protein HBI56_045930 [Parastagonospora nodorum]|uniref:Uncharacterized protein n=1 Tax=Phaeosphaeria nodorum (strain SN15 / ATCC MYA-4574 / FGSC 10173) TaxID=321614 RepID=A0A7U2ES21_PHANO|nr:hypothetical protein HBH56_059080 [Parastagonospora nodorum]QRC91776.1 hypothetical protein JI435_401670 [Parastagonospora nodorum SN15]KAH3930824.1 hypothetical protein HBH54_103010 [Parastagonospora nodorum]KAH3943845.1 hypothetical protein HBH53_166280 [Parastagonospora nodorum]KAH3965398.1 hypothetical protein HBH51_151760 [Parastagonospora nodorum]